MELLYYIEPFKYQTDELVEKIKAHENIKFVSISAVDLGNNHTDEKIPIEDFFKSPNAFLENGIQTDGSSVHLPKIAVINHAKVDLKPDTQVKWFVDYNHDHIDDATQLPVGTLLIPAFLIHDGKAVGSRAVLKNTRDYIASEIIALVNDNPHIKDDLGLSQNESLSSITLTMATEVEFWVRTPDSLLDVKALSTSQTLKEQYWKRTIGPVRTALEKSLLLLKHMGFKPEMGHKEVGGVHAKLKNSREFGDVLEQLEIDWAYDHAMQSADNELFGRDIIKDVFTAEGLDANFSAKPIEGVAGSGEHHHLGISGVTSSGRIINLFAPQDMESDFLNILGYGAMMGLLGNYELLNPFITASNDAFNRLKPGFEAPVCIVGSLGHSPKNVTRNRTVLVGLVRDLEQPLATRFELRSPNPLSNSYLLTAASFLTMLDGIKYAVASNKNKNELWHEIDKRANDPSDYLQNNREYICEKDVFDDYSDEMRSDLFGPPPKNVYENIAIFYDKLAQHNVFAESDIITAQIIASYMYTLTELWVNELSSRLVPQAIDKVKRCQKMHQDSPNGDNLDDERWKKIQALRLSLIKDTKTNHSLFTQIKTAIEDSDYARVSKLQLDMQQSMQTLKLMYNQYRDNCMI